ncbi:hypothetical protein M8818_003773 [Zalaria obscura]|uniref:Uncharacterized protein n=1 Tax=Zalaria obscura TaxID=2024903 RepID=A0ACC3SHS4_9PEZI
MLHPPPAEDVHAKNQGATIRQIGTIPDETSPERQEGRSPANPSIFGHPPAFLALTTDNSAPNDAESERPKTVRSKSIGSLTTGAVTAGAPPRPDRPTLHNRSVSFGAQVAGPPPTGPLPPLPSNPFWTGTSVAGTRPSGIFKPYVPAAIAAEDTSPHESTTITPNYGKIPEGWETVVKETVDRSTTITKEPTKDSSRSMKEGPTTKQPTPIMHHSSVRSTTARFSMGSNTSNRLSNSSIASSIAETANAHRLSIPQIQTADRVSISRVSSDETLRSIGSVQLLSTPKRRTMSRVSALGSPQERRRALRTVSGNAITPSRQASNATQASSTRSSNGNPFQWDTPLQPGKPSALKGSPTARSSKGHKRQNCTYKSVDHGRDLGGVT